VVNGAIFGAWKLSAEYHAGVHAGRSPMDSIYFMLMLVMIGATVVVYFARDLMHHGHAWAIQVCSFYSACDNFYFLAAGTAIVSVLYFISSRRA